MQHDVKVNLGGTNGVREGANFLRLGRKKIVSQGGKMEPPTCCHVKDSMRLWLDTCHHDMFGPACIRTL